MKLSIVSALGMLSALIVSPVRADGLFCGKELVDPGDSTYEVRSRCGAPDQVSTRVVERRVTKQVPRACAKGERQKSCTGQRSVKEEIHIERWTYDFGKRQFIKYLTFENDRLVSIARGGYGHKVD